MSYDIRLDEKYGHLQPIDLHRTRAPQRTVVLMLEGAGVVPTGDEDGSG
jgi:hypothetical protein